MLTLRWNVDSVAKCWLRFVKGVLSPPKSIKCLKVAWHPKGLDLVWGRVYFGQNGWSIERRASYQWPCCQNWKTQRSKRNWISSFKVRLHHQDAGQSWCRGRPCEYNELLAWDCLGYRGRLQLYSWPRISGAVKSYWTSRATLVWYNMVFFSHM